MRQIILDTETTGIDPKQGHRIIEIGGVELVNRRLTGKHFHEYVNPEREVEEEALQVHGISNEFLHDKPLFKEVAEKFIDYIDGAELIIHNAPFDIGFLNHEFKLMRAKVRRVTDICSVIDTLAMARQLHPGQRSNLDALCKRYGVDNTNRELHGALLDSEILAQVYLAMTGGQTALFAEADEKRSTSDSVRATEVVEKKQRDSLLVIEANEQELTAHQTFIDKLEGNEKLWE